MTVTETLTEAGRMASIANMAGLCIGDNGEPEDIPYSLEALQASLQALVLLKAAELPHPQYEAFMAGFEAQD